ncbi:MAG TPA: calcium-binding EGF-like domain-containing protein [Kofleriaceae bacterium]|nr:calcium-binding EGF-like domain-containing protein [Kofleriaceae bacterium]
MGWEGDGVTCTDVNECMTANGGCDPNAACFNNDGGRNCGCNTGFVGDGTTCRRVWTSRGSAAIKLTNIISGQTNDASVTAVDDLIYFAPEIGGDGDISNHFMRTFDTQSMTFNPSSLAVPPAMMSDFCACGYGQVFVGDSTGNVIYMFGGDSFRYNVVGNTWSAVSGYATVMRGEAAGAFEGNSGTVYMIGGRGPLDTTLRYNVAGAGMFLTTGTPTLPFAIEDARAWAPLGNNVVYVAGGRAGDNSRQHFLSHATGTNVWTQLPNTPIQDTLVGMGDWQGKIWIASRTQMAFFDLATNQWRAPISVPGGFVAAVAVGTRTFGLFQGGDTLEVMELTAIE